MITIIMNHHYDEAYKTFWMMVKCQGSTDNLPNDFKIYDVDFYNGKSRRKDALYNSLVPYIGYDRMEDEASAFLKTYYPEALCITLHGESTVYVGPEKLAQK